ncbi:5-formyltetrahydrofolate cyclo-ligase [Streptomyces sp. NPDC054784]
MNDADFAKRELRRQILAGRTRLPWEDAETAPLVLSRRARDLPEVAAARTVAAYVSVGREPGTRPLLDALREAGTRVLLPVLLADDDLDWGVYGGADSLRPAARRRGLLEPAGPYLTPDAVTEADVVLLPGLAVDAAGMRLGRGGGSYDRVLTRLAAAGAAPALVVLLYDGEVLPRVPAEPHDRPVTAAVTPSGVHRFTARAERAEAREQS